ncbi:quinoprotein dehydrogenase-associated putative ABC transporter substrate-binding protein [Hyphomicrobium sp. 802]|uniref:quinoprotein dehydrogenase-associated putative ABC transporter substrate-binding protein n=1 Tax=Hyphomicrobium sp. 802 TaxID=1112272 RepID=UPI00045EC2E6|nr:quinoprotein dehydrogenase-associated putative ABC transporter substrate-binding protein [Hyphomicrobium sp. 802]
MYSRFLSLACGAITTVFLASSPAISRELKVCADPNNMPYSNAKGEGFENRIAELVATDMGATAKFIWKPEWRGFVRKGLKAGLCDVVPGVPTNFERVRATKPYYTASYAFVQRQGASPITSFDDERLKTSRIGVQLVGNDGANTPPMDELARRGLNQHVQGFMVYGDWSKPNPLAPIVDAVSNGDIDIALVWGPIADYYAAREIPPLRVTPVTTGRLMSFSIAMGVRKQDKELANEINRIIDRRRDDIRKILADYNITPSMDQKSATAE